MENYLNTDIISEMIEALRWHITSQNELLLKIVTIIALFELIKAIIFFKSENKVKNAITNLIILLASFTFLSSITLVVTLFYNGYGLDYIPYFVFASMIITSILATCFYIFYGKIKLFLHKVFGLILNNKYYKKAISYINNSIAAINEELKNENEPDSVNKDMKNL